jgi:Ca2+:H+ antiporter
MESQPLLPSRDTRSIVVADLHGVKNILVGSYVNVLLVFIPFALASEFLHWSDSVIFTLNFIAIIPLAKLLGTGNVNLQTL